MRAPGRLWEVRARSSSLSLAFLPPFSPPSPPPSLDVGYRLYAGWDGTGPGPAKPLCERRGRMAGRGGDAARGGSGGPQPRLDGRRWDGRWEGQVAGRTRRTPSPCPCCAPRLGEGLRGAGLWEVLTLCLLAFHARFVRSSPPGQSLVRPLEGDGRGGHEGVGSSGPPALAPPPPGSPHRPALE